MMLSACSGNNKHTSTTSYDVSLKMLTKSNAPALQSFVHGVNGSDWLLFSGRTNESDSIAGGLHDFTDYSYTGFPDSSFNQYMYAYNVDADQVWSVHITAFIEVLKQHDPKFSSMSMDDFMFLFINTNPLITQEDDYLYILGGYGPFKQTPQGDSTIYEYKTFNHIMQVHVPTMISLIKYLSDNQSEEATKLMAANPDFFRLGSDPSDKLVSTGGELFKIGSTFYLSGGHNFEETVAIPGKGKPQAVQNYVNAVFPFTISTSGNTELSVSIGEPISNIKSDSLGTPWADSLSVFRRRDGPMVPSLNQNGTALEEGITFYTGVFMFSAVAPWTNAIYVHPSQGNGYTYDEAYAQYQNVYACADFVAYDSATGVLHTYLMGGIGAGKSDSKMSFTNDGLQISRTVKDNATTQKPLANLFSSSAPYYGAEAALMVIGSDLKFYGESNEIIDLAQTFASGNAVAVGYIYGGIEAEQSNPGGYGSGKSMASNKIWQVTLTKNTTSK